MNDMTCTSTGIPVTVLRSSFHIRVPSKSESKTSRVYNRFGHDAALSRQ
jgi:hypothetical protein